ESKWNGMPDGAGRQNGRVFVTETGNVTTKTDIGKRLNSIQSRQVAAGTSLMADWRLARDALIEHLTTQGHYDRGALAALTFTDLGERTWDEETQGLIDAWESRWNSMPNGAGRQKGRVFVTKTGNVMTAQQIGSAMSTSTRET
ncbi:hypothetical protein RY831_32840, partial [Noviherbaspirillum sp. CPCC 100848]